MAQNADEPAPSLEFFFAQRLRDVGENEQRVWPSILTKGSASNFPSTRAAGKGDVHRARRFANETISEPYLLGGSAEQSLGDMAEEPFSGAIHKS